MKVRKTGWWVGVVLAVMLAVVAVKEGRHYVFVDNFGVVEEGVLYRSGQPKPYQLAALIEEYGIRTVINTREEGAPEDLMAGEAAVCEAAGVEMVRLPMSGDGRGDYAQYDQAMAILADGNRLPALVHCARGTHRTGALVASWRVQAGGWDPAAALAEMTRYRFKPEDHVLVPHLRAYWNQRAGARTPRPEPGDN